MASRGLLKAVHTMLTNYNFFYHRHHITLFFIYSIYFLFFYSYFALLFCLSFVCKYFFIMNYRPTNLIISIQRFH